jgi:hypothetical protein
MEDSKHTLLGNFLAMTRQGLDGSKIIPIIQEGSDNCLPVLVRWIADDRRNFRQDETLNSHNYISAIFQNGGEGGIRTHV